MLTEKPTYQEIMTMTSALVAEIGRSKLNITSVYGVPRGGVPVAMLLASHLGLPVVDTPNEYSLIVDDICDSGKTLARFPNHHTATLYVSANCQKTPTFYMARAKHWVEFPWEIGEAPGEDAVTRILEAIGEDPAREGLQDTPRRVVKSWREIFGGYLKKPEEVLGTTFDAEGYYQMVVLHDIEMFSTCEHHMLPFFGKAHVAYIPKKRVVGLSKLARLVEAYSRRLQIQERLTQQIAEAIQQVLDPVGVGVVIEAKHFCMVARGVGKQNSVMTTSHLIGAIKDEQDCRDEFLKLIGK